MPIVLKSVNLNLLEPCGPVQACNGIALPLPLLLTLVDKIGVHGEIYTIKIILLILCRTSCASKYSFYAQLTTSHIGVINPLNAKLNPICNLLALLRARHILHVSRIMVNIEIKRKAIYLQECHPKKLNFHSQPGGAFPYSDAELAVMAVRTSAYKFSTQKKHKLTVLRETFFHVTFSCAFTRDVMSAHRRVFLGNKIFFVTVLPTARLYKPTSISHCKNGRM